MGTDRLLPQMFGWVHPKYRTPAVGTVIFGLITLIMTWLYIYSSSVASSFDTVVESVGVLFALFYAATGIATTWFYRVLLRRSAKDALLVGALPLAGAGALLYIAAKSLLDFSGQALWSMAGIAIAGALALIFAAAVKRSSFFRLKPVRYEEPTQEGEA